MNAVALPSFRSQQRLTNQTERVRDMTISEHRWGLPSTFRQATAPNRWRERSEPRWTVRRREPRGWATRDRSGKARPSFRTSFAPYEVLPTLPCLLRQDMEFAQAKARRADSIAVARSACEISR